MFDIEKMPSITESDGKPRYLFEGNNCALLNSDIKLINKSLKENSFELIIPELNFNTNLPSGGPVNYTFLWLNEFTPTGKKPKYIYTVYFNTFVGNYIKEWGNDTFGEIYYLQSGKIGKVRIIFWRDKLLTVIHLKLSDNGDLIINKIENK